MRQAYGINLAAFGSVAGDGTGQTIAIVDAYNEPTITSDLAAFDANFGLSAPPSFKVVNQTGGSTLPPADSRGWVGRGDCAGRRVGTRGRAEGEPSAC